MQIMAILVGQGVAAREYMAYTSYISQLAQKYQWWSVLLFDREYRQLQANNGFKWGTDFPAFRDANLVPKERKGPTWGQGRGRFRDQGPQGRGNSGRQGPSGMQSGSRNFGGQSSGMSNQKRGDDDRRFQVCKDFNFRQCNRKVCYMMHVCLKCRSQDHGEANHPK